MIWLKTLGLCPRGGIGAFVEGGSRVARDAILPINIDGGQFSGGCMHACSQLWDRAGERQVAPHQVTVAAADGGPRGGSLLWVRD